MLYQIIKVCFRILVKITINYTINYYEISTILLIIIKGIKIANGSCIWRIVSMIDTWSIGVVGYMKKILRMFGRKNSLYWEYNYKKNLHLRKTNNKMCYLKKVVFRRGCDFLGRPATLNTFEPWRQWSCLWRTGVFYSEEIFPVLLELGGGGVISRQRIVCLEFPKYAILISCPENTLLIPFV